MLFHYYHQFIYKKRRRKSQIGLFFKRRLKFDKDIGNRQKKIKTEKFSRNNILKREKKNSKEKPKRKKLNLYMAIKKIISKLNY